MEHLLLINFIFLIAILPIFYIRRTYFRRNIFLGRFLGNYIFIAHYIFFLLIILGVVNFFYRLNNLNILTVAFVVLPILFVYSYKNFSFAKVIKNEIRLENYDNQKKIRIAFISDVHLSALTNKQNIENSLKKMSEEEPDILLIGGDLVDFSYKDIKSDFTTSFREVEPKYGMYAVLGNHEYHGGIEDNIKYIESLGIKILRDNVLKVNGLNIIGRDDITNKNRKKISDFIEGIDENQPKILLDHNPKSISEAIINKIDLELCGHTHRGQFFPYNLIVKKIYKNHHGYKKFGLTNTVVSAGFSSWLIPHRIRSTSEINIIDLYY